MNKSPRRPRQNIDLVREPIKPALVRLAMPIMASAFLSTAYNLTDMAWVGTLGADAVAAVGVGGMYTWLSAGVITLARMGGQVLVGQELGAENRKKAASYARASVQLGILLGILYGLISLLFAKLSQYLSDICFYLLIYYLSAIFRCKYDMILASPLRM